MFIELFSKSDNEFEKNDQFSIGENIDMNSE
jgi:hypothetical protein